MAKRPMSTAVAEPVYTASPTERSRKRWTRDETHALERAGVLAGQHLELIEGELLNKMGKSRPHVNAARELRIWLEQVFGAEFVDCEAPIEVANPDQTYSEPEPDVVAYHKSFKPRGLVQPQASDIALLVEISDSTLAIDLSIKAPLYARAGVSDYWVVDVNAQRLIVHRDPEAGRYGSVSSYGRGEQNESAGRAGRGVGGGWHFSGWSGQRLVSQTGLGFPINADFSISRSLCLKCPVDRSLTRAAP